jgi:beta-glucanase (GH16 family)
VLAGVCAWLLACADDPHAPGELTSDAASELPTSAPDAGGSVRKADARAAALGDARAPVPSASDAAAPRPTDAEQARGSDAAQALDAASSPASSGADRAGFKLVFADDFEGSAGTPPDPTKWVFETGGGGFGNNELEYYTARPENASLDGRGMLVITARAESYMGSKYTSARLKTAGMFEHTYGRYEARLRIPKGQGIWPAFWMLGADIGKSGWPLCGEIDIMENIGKEPALVHGTLHGPGYSGGNDIGKASELPGKAAFAGAFHEFAIEWEEKVVRWYVDGVLYQTRTPSDLPQGAKWVYDHPFFILLNLAVGGQWPGSPDGSTTFPQTLTVDYVRAYERT